MITRTNEKIRAIEAYTESTVINNDGQRFEMEDGTEWLVLDDYEADEFTREEIEDSLWAFKPDFIIHLQRPRTLHIPAQERRNKHERHEESDIQRSCKCCLRHILFRFKPSHTYQN